MNSTKGNSRSILKRLVGRKWTAFKVMVSSLLYLFMTYTSKSFGENDFFYLKVALNNC